jgi:hypothetical protein
MVTDKLRQTNRDANSSLERNRTPFVLARNETRRLKPAQVQSDADSSYACADSADACADPSPTQAQVLPTQAQVLPTQAQVLLIHAQLLG